MDLHLSISNDFVSSKIYDKRDDFDFDIVNFPFLDCDVPRRPSYGVFISQLIRFARAPRETGCSHIGGCSISEVNKVNMENLGLYLTIFISLILFIGNKKEQPGLFFTD